MALNITGRSPPGAENAPSGRTAVVVLSCFGAATVLAGLVFAAALRQHKPPPPLPPLVGTDRTPAAAQPKPAAAPAEAWIVHKAAAQPPAPSARAPAGPRPQNAQAAAKTRMLATLRQVPHGTITLSVEDDAGAQAYADKLAELFREAGWTVDESSAFGPGPSRHGLGAAFGVSPADEAVREAFDAVGFQFQPPPRDAGVIRTPEIFVGAPYGR